MKTTELPLLEFARRQYAHVSQRQAIKEIMSDGRWHTAEQIQAAMRVRYGMNAIATGVAARIREFRSERHGRHQVDSEPTERDGIWRFKLHGPGTHAVERPKHECPTCHAVLR